VVEVRGQVLGLSVGPSDMNSFVLFEVDASGRRTHTEFFATDRLAEAIVRLYERHAEHLPEVSERAGAAATARTLATLLAARLDVAALTPQLEPDLVYVDHRQLGFGTLTGAAAVIEMLLSLFEAVDDSVLLVEEVLAAVPNGVLLHWIPTGTDRSSGGRFERARLSLT